MQRALIQTLTLSLLVALAGCDASSLPSIDMDWTRMSQPTARVRTVDIVEQTEEGARLEFTIELSNPNEVALPLLVTDYEVSIEGGSRFSFVDTVNRTIPARGTQSIRVAAAVPTRGRDLTGAAYSVNGLVRYLLPGELPNLAVESGIPPPAVGFTLAGKLGQEGS